jgi:hypothetical protein
MNPRALRWRALAAGGLAVLASCNNQPAPPHGSPVLTDVFWIAGDKTALVWSKDATDSIESTAPPFVDEIDFVFDRRLDGDLIEDTFVVDGVPMTRPKADPPVHVTWPEMASAPVAGFSLSVQYNSVARYGHNSAYVLARPAQPGLPASDVVTFTLDAARLASAYGEPAVLPASMTIPVQTSGLTVALTSQATPVGGSFQMPIAFSNRLPPPPASGTSPFIHVRAGGADVPYKLLADASVSSRWYVAPADCLGKWPAATTFTVVVDPGAPDVFGAKLVEGASATFSTSAAAAAPADCGVATPDGGASDAAVDGGAPDAANDAATPDGGASDAAASDAGNEAAASDAAPSEAAASDAAPSDAAASDAAPSDAAASDAADVGAGDASIADATAAP